jgi:hypothetical protein
MNKDRHKEMFDQAEIFEKNDKTGHDQTCEEIRLSEQLQMCELRVTVSVDLSTFHVGEDDLSKSHVGEDDLSKSHFGEYDLSKSHVGEDDFQAKHTQPSNISSSESESCL